MSQNPLQTLSQFLREVQAEGMKVAWPDRRQTMTGTTAVVVFVIIMASFLGLTDFLISKLMNSLLN